VPPRKRKGKRRKGKRRKGKRRKGRKGRKRRKLETSWKTLMLLLPVLLVLPLTSW